MAKMTVDLPTCARLLSMIARKLGHDYLLLTWSSKENWCRVVFGHYENYGAAMLEADGRQVWIKIVDAAGHNRSNEDIYGELSKRLYAVLENGGKLSDGKNEVDASDVAEFMIECVLNGYA